MKTLKDFINYLLARGKHFFAKKDAIKALSLSPNQFRYQAYRLSKKRNILGISNDYFIIIPPEYYHLESLPGSWIVDNYFKFINKEKKDYYIGLLSAASIYGATEQQPMIFQIISNKRIKPIKLKSTIIKFYYSKNTPVALKDKMKVQTGYVQISKKEQTIIDLVKFYKVSGYLDNVALVIKSLAAKINAKTFTNAIHKEQTNAVLQRLGYILEKNNLIKLSEIVGNELKQRKIEYYLLQPNSRVKTGEKSKTWKLILNENLEEIE